MTGNTAEPGGRGRRITGWIVAVLAVLLGGLYIAGWYFTGERVPAGTTVRDIAIGGLNENAAVDRVESGLDGLASRPVTLTYDGRTFELDPAEAGLRVDAEATVHEAGAGRSWNPIRMIDVLTGSADEVEPVAAIDDEALDDAVSDVAGKLDGPPVEPVVSFARTGRLIVTNPEVGRQLDQEATRDAVVESYLRSTEPIELPVAESEPRIGAEDFRTVLRRIARPAVAGPVTLQLPGQQLSFRVADYAPALTLTPEGDTMVLGLDPKKFQVALQVVIEQAGSEPTDATVALRDGRPVVVPAELGVTLDPQEVARKVLPALTKKGPRRTATVGTVVARPDFTTKDAAALKIKQVVSEFTTYYPYAEYRNINQARAAELMSGTVVKPGETFSFNETVGERTEANGFTKGFIIRNGVFAEDLGGGVSQVVTTTYNAAFFAGMTDIEHKPHSFYIDRYPLGREATVAWPNVDFKFRNDTPYGVLIEAWVVPGTSSSSGQMHVRFWSTKYWDIEAGVSERYDFTQHETRYDPSDECVPSSGYGGFDVDVYRTFRRAGSNAVVKKETQHVTYIPADTVICSARPR